MIAADLHGRIDALVIGASAGGVEAFITLLPALPRGLTMPIFIVQHLPRTGQSRLVELLAPRCAVPVREAEDKEPVDGGTVYFAPPDYHLLIDKGPALALSADDPINFSRPSIDVLFESAADLYGARLGAIVLTGANGDGAAGLVAVERAGGVTIVQDPATAVSSAMPAAALARVDPDFVLTLAGIAALLGTLDTVVRKERT